MISEICDFVVENKEMLISAGCAVVGIVSAIVSQANKSKTKRLSVETAQLIREKLKSHRIICPHCHKEVDFSQEVQFIMPDGSIDNDLDGKKDPD